MKRPILRVTGIEEGEVNEIREEDLPSIKKVMTMEVQEVYRTPNILNQKLKKASHHIIIKTLNIQNKERMLRAAKEKVK